MAKRILFMDDSSIRAAAFLRAHPGAVWVETAAECVKLLAEPWGEVHLDYDLGWTSQSGSGVEESGMGVVKWIAENKPEHLRQTAFTVHSMSRHAARLMVEKLKTAGYYALYRPFEHASGD